MVSDKTRTNPTFQFKSWYPLSYLVTLLAAAVHLTVPYPAYLADCLGTNFYMLIYLRISTFSGGYPWRMNNALIGVTAVGQQVANSVVGHN